MALSRLLERKEGLRLGLSATGRASVTRVVGFLLSRYRHPAILADKMHVDASGGALRRVESDVFASGSEREEHEE
jgi:hypothetical protein